jgi:hypothetical protein
MKTIFRKAITVLGSVALIGATVGAAAAASYPSPFTSNSAIVVGANAAPSDSIAASSIAADLDAAAAGSMSGGTTTVSGGDSYKFEKTSTKYHLGDTITAVISTSLDEDELPTLLVDGVYTDDDNDEFDYTQSITMAANQLKMFEDNDYKDNDPTVGFQLASGANVLNYTFTFSDEPLIADMPTTNLKLMGREYYVLAAAYNVLTLLDSASDTIVAEGETVTLTAGGKTYTVSIEYVGSTDVKLKINGETTNSLAEAETYKLSDGSYVGVKEILYSEKDTGISKVEFSIGNGKLVLTSGSDVELNEENINGLTATLVNDSTSMTSITLQWNTDDEEFVTEDSMVVIPGFESIQLAFGGLNYAVEEEIMVANSGDDAMVLENFPLKDSTEDISLLYANATAYVGIGKDSDELLRTSNSTSITFDGDTDSYFVASYNDGRDAESYLMRATNFKEEDSINKTTFQYRKDGAWVDAKVDRQSGDTVSIGNVELSVSTVNRLGKSVIVSNNSAQTSFNTLYSAEGLKVFLPFPFAAANYTAQPVASAGTGAFPTNTSATGFSAPTTFSLVFDEEDKDGDIGDGPTITAVLGLNSQSPAEVQVSSYSSGGTLAGQQEVGDSDVYRDFVYSQLATEIFEDQGPDQKTLKLIYHGEEVSADVYITSSDAVISSDGGEAGVMTVLDSAVSSVAGKNLIVVGGSAINSVAAELLGGAYREAEFTSMTGVGTGEFLIQSFDRSGNTALLVAGYNAADTTKAATYLVNNAVDTAAGTKYKGTSATEATLVVA